MIELIRERTMLNTVIIDISKVNSGDSIEEFLNNTSYEIITDLSSFDGDGSVAFLITDSQVKRFIAGKLGIGSAVYLHEDTDTSDYSDVLYCIDTIKDMSDNTLLRMYQREKNIPWNILETEHFILREMTVDDLDELYELYDDPDIKRFIEDLYEDRERELQFTIDYINNQYRFFEYGMWIVVDKATGKLIGRAGVFDREGQEISEIGFIFDKEYQGKGYAYEVMSAIVEYAKEELYKDRLISFTKNENIKAKNLLERLGFKYVGEEEIDLGKFDKYEK